MVNPGEIVSYIESLGYRICLTIRQTRRIHTAHDNVNREFRKNNF